MLCMGFWTKYRAKSRPTTHAIQEEQEAARRRQQKDSKENKSNTTTPTKPKDHKVDLGELHKYATYLFHLYLSIHLFYKN